MWYNYARFENPFEFGNRYLLNYGDCRGSLFILKAIPDGVLDYCLGPCQFETRFPYADPVSSVIDLPFIFRERSHENYVGLFLACPICLLALVWFRFIGRLEDIESRRTLAFFGLMTSLWFGIILVTLSAFLTVTFRYETEIQMPLLLATTLTLLARREVGGPFLIWERVVLSVLLFYSCYLEVAYGLTGNNHWIQVLLYQGKV